MTQVAFTRPRVFISSTILDLRDVRSAVRYWLEEAGYDVQMSEYNDFERRPEDDTFEACFANVRASDFYVLLVGAERGSWYQEGERVTVTQQEFREACRSAADKSPRIIAFARQEVTDALQQWQADGRPDTSSGLLKDPYFTEGFLDEVRASMGTSAVSGYRWLYRFWDLRDIIDALRVTLRLNLNLQRRLLTENLLNELVHNLTLMVYKTKDGHAFPHHDWVESARKDIVITREELKGGVWLASKQVSSIGMISTAISFLQFVRRSAIQEALRSGLFLEMESSSGEFKETEAHRALALLDQDLDRLGNDLRSDFQKQINQKLMGLAVRANTNQLGAGAFVEGWEMAAALGMHDRVVNVFNAMSNFAQWLLGVSASPKIDRRSLSPVEGMSEEIEAEWFTGADLKTQLKNKMFPFGPKLTRGLQELMLRDERLVSHIRSMLPSEVAAMLSDDEVREVAAEAMRKLSSE